MQVLWHRDWNLIVFFLSCKGIGCTQGRMLVRTACLVEHNIWPSILECVLDCEGRVSSLTWRGTRAGGRSWAVRRSTVLRGASVIRKHWRGRAPRG